MNICKCETDCHCTLKLKEQLEFWLVWDDRKIYELQQFEELKRSEEFSNSAYNPEIDSTQYIDRGCDD